MQLTPVQKARKDRIIGELNELIDDIEATGDKLNERLPSYEQADRENQAQMRETVHGLMNDAE